MRWLAILLAGSRFLCAQIQNGPPLPYRVVEDWPQLPAGWNFGEVAAVDVDANDNVWVFSDGPHPVMQFDKVRQVSAGMARVSWQEASWLAGGPGWKCLDG